MLAHTQIDFVIETLLSRQPRWPRAGCSSFSQRLSAFLLEASQRKLGSRVLRGVRGFVRRRLRALRGFQGVPGGTREARRGGPVSRISGRSEEPTGGTRCVIAQLFCARARALSRVNVFTCRSLKRLQQM